ncbi:MAG: PHP domain-containing protein [Planctomycetes bacterium]|nr:PHP domain-containing protein [Planctomycetota bacterium]
MPISVHVDTHTHTVLSGHAWSTLRENAVGAAKRGLTGMCLTEHGHAMPGAGPFFLTTAQKMLPPEVAGIRVFYGVEANIIDIAGTIDIEDRMLFNSEWNVASMHEICCTVGNETENTEAYLKVLDHPAIDMLGHIDDWKTPNDFETVIKAARDRGRLIEINNNSLLIRKGSMERVSEVIRLCNKLDARVAISSDAHFDEMVGSVQPAIDLMAKLAFPEQLVVNRSLRTFEAYLKERNARVHSARDTFLGNRRSERRLAKMKERGEMLPHSLPDE